MRMEYRKIYMNSVLYRPELWKRTTKDLGSMLNLRSPEIFNKYEPFHCNKIYGYVGSAIDFRLPEWRDGMNSLNLKCEELRPCPKKASTFPTVLCSGYYVHRGPAQ